MNYKEKLEKQGKQIFANSCKICKKSQRMELAEAKEGMIYMKGE